MGWVGQLLIDPFLALLTCQSLLLALWGIASASRFWRRWAGLIGGLVCLEMLVALSLRGPLLGTVTITWMLTWAVLRSLRAVGVLEVLRPVSPKFAPSGAGGFKVSIGTLMLATAAIALIVEGTRTLAKNFSTGWPLPLVAGWAVGFAVLGLVTIWTTLGARPAPAPVAGRVRARPPARIRLRPDRSDGPRRMGSHHIYHDTLLGVPDGFPARGPILRLTDSRGGPVWSQPPSGRRNASRRPRSGQA